MPSPMFRNRDSVRLISPHSPSCLPAKIKAGETGTVVDVDSENGDIAVRLDNIHGCLDSRANLIFVGASQVNAQLKRDRFVPFIRAFKRSSAAAITIWAVIMILNSTSVGITGGRSSSGASPFTQLRAVAMACPSNVTTTAALDNNPW